MSNAPAVEVAYSILRDAGEPLDYRELLDKVVEAKQIVSDDLAKTMARIYTEINLDPRFAYVSSGAWGLREWAPRPQGTRLAGTPVLPQRPRQPERWVSEEGTPDDGEPVRRQDDDDDDWPAESD